MTKYSYYDPSGSGTPVYFVMIHDFNPNYPSGMGNWGFVPAWCFQ